jgi:hypothetical protein
MLTPELELWSTAYDNKPVRNTLYRTLIFWQEKTNWQKNNFICLVSFPDKTSVSSYTSASGWHSGNDFIQSNCNHFIGSELYKWQMKDPNIQTTVKNIKTMIHVVVLKCEAQCFPWGTEDAESQPFSPSTSQHVKLFAPDVSYANCLLQAYVTHNIWHFFYDENFTHWTATNNWKARHIQQLLQWLPVTYTCSFPTDLLKRQYIYYFSLKKYTVWMMWRAKQKTKQILISDLSDFLYQVKKWVGPCVFTVGGPCLCNIFLPNTVSQIVATYTHYCLFHDKI